MEKEDQKQEQNARGNDGQEIFKKICGSRKYCKEREARIQFKED